MIQYVTHENFKTCFSSGGRSKHVEAAFPTYTNNSLVPGDFAHWASQVPSFGWTDGVGKEASLATREGQCLGSAVAWVVGSASPAEVVGRSGSKVAGDFCGNVLFKMEGYLFVDTFVYILLSDWKTICCMPSRGWNWKVVSCQSWAVNFLICTLQETEKGWGNHGKSSVVVRHICFSWCRENGWMHG